MSEQPWQCWLQGARKTFLDAARRETAIRELDKFQSWGAATVLHQSNGELWERRRLGRGRWSWYKVRAPRRGADDRRQMSDDNPKLTSDNCRLTSGARR